MEPEPRPVTPRVMVRKICRLPTPPPPEEAKTGGPCHFAKYLWELDDSGNVVFGDSRKTLKHGGAEGPDKKGNAWLGYDESPGYWEFEVLGSGGFWLGVTTEENFGSGNGIKGLFYGGSGDLSDGESVVETGWGPMMEKGDEIGMRLEQKEGHTTLAFNKGFASGIGLGIAFDIQGWDEGKFVPAVSLEKPGQEVKIKKFESKGAPDIEGFNTVKNEKIATKEKINWMNK